MQISGRAIGDIVGAKERGMFFKVNLPPSTYYKDYINWTELTTNAEEPNYSGGQVICNGKLWRFSNSAIRSYDLITGEKLSEIGYNGVSPYRQNASGIVTDGERYIWYTYQNNLYSFDAVANESPVFVTNGMVYVGTTWYSTLFYSKKTNKIYNVGGRDSSNGSRQPYVRCYDVTEKKVISLADIPTWMCSGEAYENEAGEIFFFGDDFSGNGAICKYNPNNNTWEIIRSTDIKVQQYNFISQSLVLVDHFVYMFYNKVVSCIDILTGNESLIPILSNSLPITWSNGVAANGSSLYAKTPTGTYTMDITAPEPEKCPIVAKIYEGQKFHADKEIEIKNIPLKITENQQIAGEDYEIRLNQYTSDGYNNIYIET